MTTAAKYGAQDLNGNPFNYQQLVSPAITGPSNLVVNANITNRGATDTKVRMALSSAPLASQTVGSTQGMYPLTSLSSAAATAVETQQVLTVDTTTTGTNIFTTASFLVTGTTAGTNLITCANTAVLIPGEAVVFSANIGGLIAGTTYYVLTVPSTTTFTVSNVLNGAVVSLSTSFLNVTVQESTITLAVGMPIQFHGVMFGGVFYNQTYYVLTIPSATTFTVSATPNGSAFALISATGTMSVVALNSPNFVETITHTPAINVASTVNSVYANTLQGLTISNTTTSSNVFTTASISVTTTTAATTSANGFITTAASGTNTLTVGMPVVFSGSLGGIIGSTIYYVLNVYSTTTFSVSLTQNGPPITLSAASGSISLQQATTNLQINQPIMFTGTVFGGVVTNMPYYVTTIFSSTQFIVSMIPGGTAVPLTTATGTMVTTSTSIPAPVVFSSTTVTSNVLTTATVAVTQTATTGLITCASTSTLAIGQPVVFSGNLGNLLANTVYYVLTVAGASTFSVSTSPTGATFVLTGATGSITVAHAVTNLQINQPIVIYGSAIGGLSQGQIYYVQNIVSNTTLQISATYGGAALPLSTASGQMWAQLLLQVPLITVGTSTATTNVYTTASISVTATSGVAPYNITCTSTATLSVGQPVVFTVSTNNIVAGTVYYVATIDSSTTFQIAFSYGAIGSSPFVLTSGTTANTVSQATTNLSVGQPVIFAGSAFGGVTASSVTYYIKTVPTSTTFTLSTAINGTVFALSSTTGTMYTTIGPRPIATVSASTGSNQIAMQTYAVTNTTITSNLITIVSTYQLAVGMPVVFSGALGNIVAGTIYYVKAIASGTQFTISATLNGPVYLLSTASGSVNLQQTTANLYINQALQFQTTLVGTYTGITFGTTYYVRTIDSNILFTLGATPNPPNTTATVVTITGGNIITFVPITNNVVAALSYRTAAVSVTATAGATTYAITCATTTTLAVGMPVVFDASLGGLVLETVYYVNAILGGTTFNVSLTVGGPVVVLSAASGTLNVFPSTSNLYVGQPVQFTGTSFGIPAALLAGQTYYVQSTPSYNTVTLALVNGNTSSSYLGLVPMGLTAGATGTMTMATVTPVPPLVVTASTGSAPYTYSTALIAVTATTASGAFGSNYITCASTATLAIGMPVIFSSGLGNLVSATVYYVTAISSATTFTISATYNGTTFVQTTTTGSINMQQTTTFLQLNQPVIFHGTVFGNVSAGVTYYVLTIASATSFTISTFPNWTAVTLAATTGTMYAIVGPYRAMNVLSTTGSTFVPATYTVTATAAVNNTMLVTANNTYSMYPGMPIAFTSGVGILVANTVYYVTSIYDERRFSLSLEPPIYPFQAATFPGAAGIRTTWQQAYGTPLVLTTTTGSATMYQSTAKLQTNQPVVFYPNIGSVFGTGVTAGTVYYVTAQVGASIAGSFSVSLTPGGAAISPGSAGGSNAAMMMVPLLSTIPVTNVYQAQVLPIVAVTTSSNTLTMGNLAIVTGTAIGTNLITCTTTSGLSVGMPIVFSAAVGNLAAATTYYVLTINSGTTFTVAQSWGGQVAILTNTFGVSYIQPSTATLSVGQPITFTGSVFNGGASIIAYTTYYVCTLTTPTTFTISTSVANALAQSAITITTTTTGYMNMVCSTAGMLSNMTSVIAAQAPLTFYGATITVTAVNGTNLYTTGNTGFLTANQPVVFTGYTFISGITAGTIYYVKTIVDSNTFTISATAGGTVLTLGTGKNTLTMQVVNPTGTALVPYAGYYVQSVPSPATFTISASSGGSVTALTATTGAVIVNSNIVTLATGGSTSYFLPNQPVVFTATAGNTTSFGGTNIMATTGVQFGLPNVITATTVSGNTITTASTVGLVIGQPVVFTGTTAGGIVAFQTYYIQSIPGGTTFCISSTVGGAAVTMTASSSQAFYMIPAYYVKTVLNSSQILLTATPNGTPVTIGTGFASGSNIVTITPQPMYTDFIEYEALIAPNGLLERTGVLVPPNTYLYVSSNTTQVNAVAIGIQELV